MKYELTITQKPDGQFVVNSRNDGCNAFEVLGFLTWKADDIIAQIRGQFKPEIVTRQVVDPEEEAK